MLSESRIYADFSDYADFKSLVSEHQWYRCVNKRISLAMSGFVNSTPIGVNLRIYPLVGGVSNPAACHTGNANRHSYR